MQTEEKILLVVSAIALACAIIFRVPPTVTPMAIAKEATVSQDPEKTDPKGGPAYLTYNQPYMWGPPVNSFLPAINMAR